jgi:heparan-alpha-glucosaminide N-acetyltransferase
MGQLDCQTSDISVAGDKGKLANKRDGVLASGRIASVDVLRGLTILVMVFVNDLGPGAPSWMHHIQPPDADGMTLADFVFPWFLFLVGMSIPLAFERAEAAGKSKRAQLVHILARAAALVFMGLIEVNYRYDRTLPQPLWGALAGPALIVAWCALPRERGWKWNVVLAAKLLAVAGLVVLLAIYRRTPGSTEILFWGQVEGWVWLHTDWWGILGLIGWAYLSVGLLVLLVGWRREWLMGALGLLMLARLAVKHGGLFTHLESKSWLGVAKEPLEALAGRIEQLGHYISLPHATGLAGITMAGCLLGTILRRDSDLVSHRARLRWAWMFAIGLLAAGFVTDTFEGINKIGATPTYCFWSAALACMAWILLYRLLDVAETGGWAAPLRAAGANALLAYFLHPIVMALILIAGLGDSVLAYKNAADGWQIIGGSLAMAVFVCLAAGLLGRLGVRMRL